MSPPPLPRPAEFRLDADELDELEQLLTDLARGTSAAPAPALPWEARAGVRSLELVGNLRTAGAKVARVGSGGGAAKAPAHMAAVPYVSAPLELAALLHGALADWAAATMRADDAEAPVGPRRPAPRSLEAADLATWLLGRLSTLAWRPGTSRPELERLRPLVRRGRATIDRRPDRRYAGPCNAGLRDAAGSLVIVAGAQARCTEDLYAGPRDRTVVCPACTAGHDVEQRRAFLLRQAREHLETAADLSRALTALGNLKCDAARIRQWKRRGRIVPRGATKAGDPLYRVGDAIELLEADAVRADRAARKAEATRRAADAAELAATRKASLEAATRQERTTA